LSDSSKRNQEATYWAYQGSNGEGGFNYNPPVSLSVRWEEKAERFLSVSGEEAISSATIFLDQDVGVFGYLFLGNSASSDPTTVPGAKRIEAFVKIPHLRSLTYERWAMVK